MELPKLDLRRATEGLNSSHRVTTIAAGASLSRQAMLPLLRVPPVVQPVLSHYFLWFADVCLPAFLIHQSSVIQDKSYFS